MKHKSRRVKASRVVEQIGAGSCLGQMSAASLAGSLAFLGLSFRGRYLDPTFFVERDRYSMLGGVSLRGLVRACGDCQHGQSPTMHRWTLDGGVAAGV